LADIRSGIVGINSRCRKKSTPAGRIDAAPGFIDIAIKSRFSAIDDAELPLPPHPENITDIVKSNINIIRWIFIIVDFIKGNATNFFATLYAQRVAASIMPMGYF
jgi:hypothetical protein